MNRISTALTLAVALAVVAAAHAQKTQRIAAIVNDDIVSMFDLQARLQMVIFSSGLPQNREVANRLAPQVLRGLIDERIRLQEAKRLNISVSKSELKSATSGIETRNKLPPGMLKDFLAKNGVEMDTVLQQLHSQIAWSKLIKRRFQPRVAISDEEIDEVLERLKARRGQTEYRIAEIYLSIDREENEPEVRRGAERLVEQLRGGAEFGAVAQQFSQAGSAAAEGDLGWLFAEDLDDAVRAIIDKLKPGEISGLLVDPSGVRILKLIGKRKVASADPGETSVKLRQIFLPRPDPASRAPAADVETLARTLQARLSGCADMDRAAREINSPSSTNLGTFKLKDLSADIRGAVKDLPIGRAAAPVATRGGLLLLMVCERERAEVKLPDRQTIELRLLNQRISRMERGYMRDLRNAAVVDLRI